MDTELRGRCTEWLAFQLSNFDFVWPWHKWLHVLKAPPHSAQRCALPVIPPDSSASLQGTHKLNVKATPRLMTAIDARGCARCRHLQSKSEPRGAHVSSQHYDYTVSTHTWHCHRRFVAAVLDRMVRLSYYDNVIQKTDKGITPLLPPKPEATPLPSKDAEGAAQNGDAANNGSLTERRRAADIIALVCASCAQSQHKKLDECENAVS